MGLTSYFERSLRNAYNKPAHPVPLPSFVAGVSFLGVAILRSFATGGWSREMTAWGTPAVIFLIIGASGLVKSYVLRESLRCVAVLAGLGGVCLFYFS